MRTLILLSFIAALSACSSGRQSQVDRATAEYDARTAAARKNPSRVSTPPSTPTSTSPAQRPETVAPVRTVDAPVNDVSPTKKDAGEWAVTSIKGKFLAIDSNTVRVFMDLTARTASDENVTSPADFVSHFLTAYVLYPDYNNRERLGYGNVTLTTQNVGYDGKYLTLTFDVARPKGATSAVLLTEFTETNAGTKARNDLTVRFGKARLSDRFTLYDKDGKPELRHYANAGDTLIIGDVNRTPKKLYGLRYQHDFEAASSPMNTSPRPVSKSLTVDSTLTITTNEPFVLPKEGLYYFMEDTTDADGIGLVVADKRFPKMTRPEKLIRPVLYMSTSTEIGELSQAQDTKKAFDRYWLSLMSGNEDVARRTLKAYFDRVEEANRLFTSYKEGWKTDKGMIYIVLGAPDRVQRNREREVWVYNRRANIPETNFTFVKKPNQFVDDHYELQRYIEYQPIWYPIVEAWRTGSIRE